ncbi:MAG: flagellar assembly protein FliH [Ketobacteraceae bacterium]|nr:flagellar assembly protein FliH [Ketobacteraceae bacterium]
MEKKKPLDSILTRDNTPAEKLSAYERWELPMVEDERAVPGTDSPFSSQPKPRSRRQAAPEQEPEDVEDVKPLTAEELEAIRQAAYDEGREEGKRDGYKEGYDQGYKSGESDLRAAVNKLAQISRALFEPVDAQDEALEKALLELVRNITTRVVHRELKLDSSCILTIVKEAVNALIPGTERVRIHLNPADLEFVVQSLKESGEMGENWNFLAHQTISPGGCIVDTDNAVVDMRAEKRLATVIRQVYEKDQQALADIEKKEAGLDQIINEVDSFRDDDDDDSDAESNTDTSSDIDPDNLP